MSDRFDDDLEQLLETRTLVQRVAAGLHREFAGVFGVETIEQVVDQSYASLAHARCSRMSRGSWSATPESGSVPSPKWRER